MEIRKQYNIGQLAEQLQKEVEMSKKYNGVVRLDVLTANNILDVLNEINRREQKHELFNIQKDMKHMLEILPSSLGGKADVGKEDEKPECFGRYKRYKKNDNWEACEECPYEMRCHMEEGKRIAKVITKEQKTEHRGCFGKYDEDDLDCLICASCDECMKETYKAEGETNE